MSSGNWQENSPPANVVNAGTTDTWHVSGEVPDFNIEYQILKPDGSPSGYWLFANFYDPIAGYNRATCRIVTTDSSLPNPLTAPAAPYSCYWSNTDGYNPNPVLHVNAATVVADKRAAEQLAASNCREGAPHCVFAVDTFSAASSGQPVLVGSPCVNASSFTLTCGFGKGQTVGESNSIATSAQVAVTLEKIVEITVTVSYTHTWEHSETYTSDASLAIDPGYAGWFTLSPVVQTASGAFLVSSLGGGQYRSHAANGTFTSPTDHGAIVGHSRILKPNTDPNNLMCQTAVKSTAPIPIIGTPGP